MLKKTDKAGQLTKKPTQTNQNLLNQSINRSIDLSVWEVLNDLTSIYQMTDF